MKDNVAIVIPARVLDLILGNAFRLSKREVLVCLVIWRYTLCHNRTEACLPLRCLEKKLTIPHQKIFPALKLLIEKDLVIQKKTDRGAILSINLRHEWFQELWQPYDTAGHAQKKNGSIQSGEETESTRKEKIIKPVSDDDLEVSREWGRIFHQPLPAGMEEKARAMLEEIRHGRIDPDNIRFPVNYLKSFSQPRKNKKAPRIRDGLKIKFQDRIYTVEHGMIMLNGGFIPPGDILRLIEKGEMVVVE